MHLDRGLRTGYRQSSFDNTPQGLLFKYAKFYLLNLPKGAKENLTYLAKGDLLLPTLATLPSRRPGSGHGQSSVEDNKPLFWPFPHASSSTSCISFAPAYLILNMALRKFMRGHGMGFTQPPGAICTRLLSIRIFYTFGSQSFCRQQ